MSYRLRGAGLNLVGGPPPLLRGARWPLAGVWRAGAAPSGGCGGLFWLVLQVGVSRAVLCFASCCGVMCFGVPCRCALHCGALPCVVPCCLVLCRGGSVGVSHACVVVQSAGRNVAGRWLGGAVRCGRHTGSMLWGPGRAARAGASDFFLGRPSFGACAVVPCPLGVPVPSPGCCGRAFVLFQCL